jgi:hypothetical protein
MDPSPRSSRPLSVINQSCFTSLTLRVLQQSTLESSFSTTMPSSGNDLHPPRPAIYMHGRPVKLNGENAALDSSLRWPSWLALRRRACSSTRPSSSSSLCHGTATTSFPIALLRLAQRSGGPGHAEAQLLLDSPLGTGHFCCSPTALTADFWRCRGIPALRHRLKHCKHMTTLVSQLPILMQVSIWKWRDLLSCAWECRGPPRLNRRLSPPQCIGDLIRKVNLVSAMHPSPPIISCDWNH